MKLSNNLFYIKNIEDLLDIGSNINISGTFSVWYTSDYILTPELLVVLKTSVSIVDNLPEYLYNRGVYNIVKNSSLEYLQFIMNTLVIFNAISFDPNNPGAFIVEVHQNV